MRTLLVSIFLLVLKMAAEANALVIENLAKNDDEQIPVISTVQELLGAKAGEYFLLPGSYSIVSSTVLPEQLVLHMMRGAYFDVNANARLEVKARIICSDYEQLWTGSGQVELYPSAMQRVSICHFGAIPGDKKDDTKAILTSIQAGYRIASIYFPGVEYYKTYDISSTIEFFHPSRIANWHVTGLKTADGVSDDELCSRIVYTGKSGPCFNFRGQRLAVMANLNIQGGNMKPAEMADKKRNSMEIWNPDNWNTAGFSMDKFNAHSAVAFDWGKDGSDGAPWSATCQIRNVVITNFVVAINISPNKGYQSDSYKFDNIKIKYCTYGVSVGQDQARSITFENMWMDAMYCAYVNNRFGRGNGSGFNVTGGQYTNIFRLFECSIAYRGQAVIAGIFTEACGLMGSWTGLGVNNWAVGFIGCEFGFDNNGWEDTDVMQWVTPFVFFQTGGNVSFNSCNFNFRKDIMAVDVGDGFAAFNGCSFGELKKFFFSNPASVAFGGRSTFRTNNPDDSFYPETVVPLRSGQRYTVRPNVQFVQDYTQGYATKPANCRIPAYLPVASVVLPNSNEKEIEITVNANEARQILAGDYMECFIKGMVPNMGATMGGAQVPGLKVVGKSGNSIRLRRVSPDIHVGNDQRTGNVYAHFSTFVGKPRQGDIVLINGQVKRLLPGDKLEGVSVEY